MVVEVEVDQEPHSMLLVAVWEVLGQPAPQTCRHLRVAEVLRTVEPVVTVHAVGVRQTPPPFLRVLSVTAAGAAVRADSLNWCLFLGG